jgi:hypothetical protein
MPVVRKQSHVSRRGRLEGKPSCHEAHRRRTDHVDRQDSPRECHSHQADNEYVNGIMPRKRQRPLMKRCGPLWRKHSNAPSVSRVRLPKSVNPTVYGIDRCPWVSDLSTDIVSCQAFCTRRRFSSRLLTRWNQAEPELVPGGPTSNTPTFADPVVTRTQAAWATLSPERPSLSVLAHQTSSSATHSAGQSQMPNMPAYTPLP